MDSRDLKLEHEETDTGSLVDKVEKRLIEVFVHKELRSGDSIPKETELASFMGVSRTVIRESLTGSRPWASSSQGSIGAPLSRAPTSLPFLRNR